MCRVNVVRKVPQDGMSLADEGICFRGTTLHSLCIVSAFIIEASVQMTMTVAACAIRKRTFHVKENW